MDSVHLSARSGGLGTGPGDRPPIFKVVGLILAICSGLFIGSSFVLKKVGLLKANAKYNEKAGEGYGYLKNVFWWSGMFLMILGEICNFVAYAFVDAILVTPLGALSVVVSTILSAIFLKERLSFVGKVGCFNCIVGSVVIAINAPVQSAVVNIQDMKRLVISPGFLSYAGVIILVCLGLIFWAAPRYAEKNMMIYISICSLIGGLSVVCTQGLGASIIAQIQGTPQFNQWFLYVLLAFVIATLLTMIIFLNKALNIFNTALVTPTYYVFFTSATIVSSAVLFRGFKGTPAAIATVILGFLQICAGVILLQLSKSAKDIPDAVVFQGDLDQVKKMADQEESEFDPRADSICGSSALIRSISNLRKKRELDESRRLHEEQLAPIKEDEPFHWDGIRRRKTVASIPGEHMRPKFTHPVFGMAAIPHDIRNDPDSDYHPGIVDSNTTYKGGYSSLSRRDQQFGPGGDIEASAGAVLPALQVPTGHRFGHDPELKRTDAPEDSIDLTDESRMKFKIRSNNTQSIMWADPNPSPDNTPTESASRPAHTSSDTLHIPKNSDSQSSRKFSFTRIFNRSASGTRRNSGQDAGGSYGETISVGKRRASPMFRPECLSGGTEEERLGLVKRHSGASQSSDSHESPHGGGSHFNDDDPDDFRDHGVDSEYLRDFPAQEWSFVGPGDGWMAPNAAGPSNLPEPHFVSRPDPQTARTAPTAPAARLHSSQEGNPPRITTTSPSPLIPQVTSSSSLPLPSVTGPSGSGQFETPLIGMSHSNPQSTSSLPPAPPPHKYHHSRHPQDSNPSQPSAPSPPVGHYRDTIASSGVLPLNTSLSNVHPTHRSLEKRPVLDDDMESELEEENYRRKPGASRSRKTRAPANRQSTATDYTTGTGHGAFL